MDEIAKDALRPEDVWNRGDLGNAAGDEVVAPRPPWNPNGVGNAIDGAERQPEERGSPIDDGGDAPE